MLWVVLMVLMATSLVAAQEKECYPYYYCRNCICDKTTIGECPHYTEKRCIFKPDTISATEKPQISPTIEPRSVLQCGIRNPPVAIDKIRVPLADEGETIYGEFPWMAIIIRYIKGNKVVVGAGSIISPNLILTAAHKVKSISSTALEVQTGVYDTTDKEEEVRHQNRAVLKVEFYPGYDGNIRANDFAILVLNESLLLDPSSVNKVCLPHKTSPINETLCFAAGWGAEQEGQGHSTTLKKVLLPLVEINKCRDKYRRSGFQLHESYICAGGGYRSDTCIGDGGGPLMCAKTTNPNQYVQVGITAWGIGCARGVPGAYSDVKYALDWISTQIDKYPDFHENKQVCCRPNKNSTVTEVPPVTSKPITFIKPRKDTKCGKRTLPDAIDKVRQDVTNRIEPAFGEFPWMVAIIRNTPEGQVFVCEGSIISIDLILTTAYKIKDCPPSELFVKAGVLNQSDSSEADRHQIRTVKQIVFHERYDSVNKVNDIAILVLDQSLQRDFNIAPVCLHYTSKPVLLDNSSCLVTSWGPDKSGKTNGDMLKMIPLPLVDSETCQNKLRASHRGKSFVLHDSLICAGDGCQENNCVGNNGGALVCAMKNDPEIYVLVGIISCSIPCFGDLPQVFTSGQTAADWIDSFPSM